MKNFFYFKAEENIKLANLCASEEFYNGWANRIYYAIYQIIHAYFGIEDNVTHKVLREHIGRFRDDFSVNDEVLVENLCSLRTDADYRKTNINIKKFNRYNSLALELYKKTKNKIKE